MKCKKETNAIYKQLPDQGNTFDLNGRARI